MSNTLSEVQQNLRTDQLDGAVWHVESALTYLRETSAAYLREINDLRHTLVSRDLDNRQLREQVRMLEATLRERGER